MHEKIKKDQVSKKIINERLNVRSNGIMQQNIPEKSWLLSLSLFMKIRKTHVCMNVT